MSPPEVLALAALVGLATWQAVAVWRHSALLADWRAAAESWAALPPGLLNAPRAFLGELLSCPWCLSLWAAWLLTALWFAPPPWWYANAFTVGLAGSRLANALHDLTKPRPAPPRTTRERRRTADARRPRRPVRPARL